MSEEDSFNPAHEQEQELLVLSSILMEEFEELAPAKDRGRSSRRVNITVLPHPNGDGENHVRASITAILPPSYPILTPELTIEAPALPEARLGELKEVCAGAVRELAGNVSLMAVTEAAREFLLQHNVPPPSSAHEQMLKNAKARAASGDGPALAAAAAEAVAASRTSSGDAALQEVHQVEAELARGQEKRREKQRKKNRRRSGRAAADDSGDDEIGSPTAGTPKLAPTTAPSTPAVTTAKADRRTSEPPKLPPPAQQQAAKETNLLGNLQRSISSIGDSISQLLGGGSTSGRGGLSYGFEYM